MRVLHRVTVFTAAASTFGRITAADVFEELFWTLFGASEARLASLNRNTTYLFELCGAQNRVVTGACCRKSCLSFFTICARIPL